MPACNSAGNNTQQRIQMI